MENAAFSRNLSLCTSSYKESGIRRNSSFPAVYSVSAVSIPQSDGKKLQQNEICPCNSSIETNDSVCLTCDTHDGFSGSYDKHYHSDTELLNPKFHDFVFQLNIDRNSEGFPSGRNSSTDSSEEEMSMKFACLSDKTLDCGATSFQNTVVAIPGRTFSNRGRCRLCFREQCYGCRYFIGYSRVSVSALRAATSLPNVSRSQTSSIDSGSTEKRKKFTSEQKWALFAIGLINLTAFLSMSIIAPFFPKEASIKGMSSSVSGLVFSIYALVSMLASPVFGYIAPNVGVKFIYFAGIIVSGVANILFGLLEYVEDPTLFVVYCFLVRSVEALGAAAFATSSNIIILEVFPDDIGTVFGLMETFVGVGQSIGPAIGGGLYSLGGYGLPFYVLGVAVLLNYPINYCLLKSYEAKCEKNDETSTYRKLLSIPHVIILSIVVVVASQAQGFVDPTLEPHFRQFNLGPEIVGLLFLLMSAAYALFSPAVGYVTGKYEIKYPTMLIGLVIMTVSLLLLGPSPFIPIAGDILWVSILGIVLLGLSFALAFIPTFEAIFNSGIAGGLSDSIGTYSIVSGLWTAMYSLGEVTGPTLGGVLSDFLTFPQAATVMALCSFLTALLVLATWMWPKKQMCSETSESDSGISDHSDQSTEKDPLITSTKKFYGTADRTNM